jgi:hypothetical protein
LQLHTHDAQPFAGRRALLRREWHERAPRARRRAPAHAAVRAVWRTTSALRKFIPFPWFRCGRVLPR